MKKTFNQDYHISYMQWRQSYRGYLTDKAVEPFLVEEIGPFKKKHTQWLRNTREALYLSTGHCAQRLKISRSAYARMERAEKDGSVTIKSLAKAAEALDCELVYAIRPKSRKRFSVLIWEKILSEVLNHPWVISSPAQLKLRRIASIALRKMEDPKTRRKFNWTER